MDKKNKMLKLKLDVIFKAIFGNEKNEEIIAAFISSLLGIPRESIKKIVMDNVELIPENFADKFCRVDLKMKVNDKIVNVEMQIVTGENFRERTIYYWARIFGSQLKSGKYYSDLKETICINIIDFNLFDCKEFHSHFKVMEKDRHEVLSDVFSIHFFELKKIDENLDENNLLKLWLQLIKAETEEEISMIENTHVKEINDAIMILRNVSADEKMRQIAEMREKALHDEANALYSAEKRGREKGKAEERKSIIEKLKKRGMSEEEIKAIIED